MNWGLHIGNKVRNVKNGMEFILEGVYKGEGSGNIMLKGDEGNHYAKDCKPILRSLSSMTEKEKVSFVKYWISHCKTIPLYVASACFYFDFESGVLYVCEAMASSDAKTPVVSKMLFYLAKEGFNCDQFNKGEYLKEDAE